MFRSSMLPPFADSASSLPAGKAVAMIIFFGSVAIVSLVGLFASNATLKLMSSVIGAENPLVARIVCAVCALIGIGVVAAALLSIAGKI